MPSHSRPLGSHCDNVRVVVLQCLLSNHQENRGAVADLRHGPTQLDLPWVLRFILYCLAVYINDKKIIRGHTGNGPVARVT